MRAEAIVLGSISLGVSEKGMEAAVREIGRERQYLNEQLELLRPGSHRAVEKARIERGLRPDGKSEVEVRLEQKQRSRQRERMARLDLAEPHLDPEEQAQHEERQDKFATFQAQMRNVFAGLHKK